jgi:hypothetical protein
MWLFHLLSSPKNRKQRRAARHLQRTGPPRSSCIPPKLEPLEARWLLNATITVTSTADDPTTPISGQTTLRDAINQANANPGATIDFNIPKSDPGFQNGFWDIQPTAALPTISSAVTIDGTSQPGAKPGNPVIAVDGTALGGNASAGTGLDVEANNVTIQGLDIIRHH